MGKLKNRKNAIIIAVAVVILGTVLGVNLSVSRETKKIEAMFYDGVYLKDDGYTEASINSHLENCVQYATTLSSVSSNFDSLEQERELLAEARKELLDADTVLDKNYAYYDLNTAFADLSAKLLDEKLDERDLATVTACTNGFKGAQQAIAKSAYNNEAGDFKYGDLWEFPVKFLEGVIFVRTPDLFLTEEF